MKSTEVKCSTYFCVAAESYYQDPEVSDQVTISKYQKMQETTLQISQKDYFLFKKSLKSCIVELYNESRWNVL